MYDDSDFNETSLGSPSIQIKLYYYIYITLVKEMTIHAFKFAQQIKC